MSGSVWRLAVLKVGVKVPLSSGDVNSSVIPAGIVNKKIVLENCFRQPSGRRQMAHSTGILRNFIEGTIYRGVSRAEGTHKQC